MGPFQRFRDVTGIPGSLLEPGVTTEGGITEEYLSRGRGKELGNPYRDMTDEERAAPPYEPAALTAWRREKLRGTQGFLPIAFPDAHPLAGCGFSTCERLSSGTTPRSSLHPSERHGTRSGQGRLPGSLVRQALGLLLVQR